MKEECVPNLKIKEAGSCNAVTLVGYANTLVESGTRETFQLTREKLIRQENSRGKVL